MALCRPYFCVVQKTVLRSKSSSLFLQWVSNRPVTTSNVRCGRWPKPRQDSNNFKITPTPFENIQIENNPITLATLWKPFIFTVAFSGGSLACCTIWQYENIRAKAISTLKQPVNWVSDQIWGKQKSGSWRRELNEQWSKLTNGQKVFVPILFANTLVLLAWRIPRLQPTMVKYFCTNPGASNLCLPMVLSTFSHYSFFHFAANMYVLHSFSTGACHSLGKEQFLGVYLAAGVISSFTSLVYKVLLGQASLSIGASGAIMAVLGYVCTAHPDTRLSIILLPMYTFTAGAAIKFIIGLDTVGVVLGWKLFDHAAHLGGALTGIAWCHWGNEYIWKKREPLLNWWHQLRSKPGPSH